MEIKVGHTKDCITLGIPHKPYDFSFYLLPKDIEPLPTWEPRVIRDPGQYAIVEPWRIFFMRLDPLLEQPFLTNTFDTSVVAIRLDANRFFKVLRILHERKRATTLDTLRFKDKEEEPPLLTASQIVHHEHTHGNVARILKRFHDNLKPEDWLKLLARISQMLPKVKLYPDFGDLYFDGRYEGGWGMNGGIILHSDNTFGVHT